MTKTVVTLLEEALELVRRGEIASVAIAAMTPTLEASSCYSLGDSTSSELAGAVAILQHRLIAHGLAERIES